MVLIYFANKLNTNPTTGGDRHPVPSDKLFGKRISDSGRRPLWSINVGGRPPEHTEVCSKNPVSRELAKKNRLDIFQRGSKLRGRGSH